MLRFALNGAIKSKSLGTETSDFGQYMETLSDELNLYKSFLPEGCESQMGHCWLCICRKLTTEKDGLSYN